MKDTCQMEILKVKQIQAWDAYTIKHEPVSSIDLMERASRVFTHWFIDQLIHGENHILVVVSKGNNGGDGLATARILSENGFQVTVLICHIQSESSRDFITNFERLQFKNCHVTELKSGDIIPSFDQFDIIIDGILGSGLTRPVTGYWASVIQALNDSNKKLYAIDIPSGLFGDRCNEREGAVIKAHDCLSFERPKLSFFFPSNSRFLRSWNVRSIGLLPEFITPETTSYFLIDSRFISGLIKKRNKFDHKGKFGKGLMIAGKKGMIGAAVLSTKAMLRTGIGLAYSLVPDCGYTVMQSNIPEAMILHGYGEDQLMVAPDISDFSCVGIGPGIGTSEPTYRFMEEILRSSSRPLVIDADALNILAERKDLIKLIPANSILTPHPGEFRRLFGNSADDLSELELLQAMAPALNCIIILKGANTMIATPEGKVFFNNTGNPGMATGGSGDVLTGIITGLLAQAYDSFDAAVLGVHLHGIAGDYAAFKESQESMIASDIINNIGQAFMKLNQYNE